MKTVSLFFFFYVSSNSRSADKEERFEKPMFRLTKTIRRSTIVYRNRYVRKYYRRVNERLRARGTSPAIFQFILIGIIYQRLTPMLLLNARAFFSCRNGGVNENPRRPLNDFHTKIPIPKEKEHAFLTFSSHPTFARNLSYHRHEACIRVRCTRATRKSQISDAERFRKEKLLVNEENTARFRQEFQPLACFPHPRAAFPYDDNDTP